MADDPTPPTLLRRVLTRVRRRPFAEPQQLEVIVLPDTETVEDVGAKTQAKPRTRTRVRRWIPTAPRARPEIPANFWLLLVVAAIALVFSWHWVFSPLVAHAEHSVERRIYGERTYEAPTSNPHVHREKKPLLGFRIW